jgi:hypothetical protein
VRTKLRIPSKVLSELEQKVCSLMSKGSFREGLEEIRKLAPLYGMDANELARQVAALALEKGHVQPLKQVDHL